jgi:membrane-associated phospholipid phosphatase
MFMIPKVYYSFIAINFMIPTLACDLAVNGFTPNIQNTTLTLFSHFIAIFFDSIVLTIVSFLIATYFFLRHREKKGIFLLMVMFFSGAIIFLLKNLFGRARPINSFVVESGYAFPSGHSTIIVVFLGLLVYLFAARKNVLKMSLVAGLLALFVGFTRLYLGVHYLSDVLAGFIVGGIILFVSIRIYGKFLKK